MNIAPSIVSSNLLISAPIFIPRTSGTPQAIPALPYPLRYHQQRIHLCKTLKYPYFCVIPVSEENSTISNELIMCIAICVNAISNIPASYIFFFLS
mmetsp:Transcript_1462/g.3157  ORF Transcript_1462/g.3157 Transcript_1462/m.3157 type:complete len:96 (-) Transcript_1462:413-700(-)